MNSLGLEYASSDEDEESAPPAPVVAATPPVDAAETPTVACNSTPAKPEHKTKETNATEQSTAGLDAAASDDELELMLQRAGIPPAPASLGSSSDTQERIAKFLRVQEERGQDFQTTLQDKKEVRNPYILEKVVEYFGIDELQSNFPKEVFDPHGLPLHEFADVLALEQKKRADARAQRQLQQQGTRQLQFVPSDPGFRG